MPIVTRDANGRFTRLRFSNQLRQPLPFDHPDLAAWYGAYRALGQLVVDPSCQVRFRLGGGQMLIVDGRRVLHGRTAFSLTVGATYRTSTSTSTTSLATWRD